jgi:hypothetical protein
MTPATVVSFSQETLPSALSGSAAPAIFTTPRALLQLTPCSPNGIAMDEDMMTGISMVVVLRGGVENIFETNQNSWDYIVFLGCGRAIIPNLEFFISGGKNPLLENLFWVNSILVKSIWVNFFGEIVAISGVFTRKCL